MKKISIIFIFIILSNCTLNKVIKHHGVHFLENKKDKLEVLISNQNDIVSLLGPASVKSTFDNDVWIYIERKTTVSHFKTLGKRKILANNVLILEIDNRGLLVKKDFLNMNDMNKLKITKSKTNVIVNKETFVSSILSSLKRKINDPLGTKKAR
tara:strand:+ start:128 stop:589 length:462 start_codon:yes stop_codon:yes gene_type:complete